MRKILLTTVAALTLAAATGFALGQSGPEQGRQQPGNAPAAPQATQNQGTQSSGGAGPAPMNRTGSDRAGQGASDRDHGQSGSAAQAPASAPMQQGQAPAQRPNTAAQQGQSAPAAQSGSQTNVSVNLSSDQRTRIREVVIKQPNAPRVNNVNFSLNIGTVIPRSVHVVALPSTVIEVHPAWRGYSYFLVGDQIVIIEPGTLRIIAVIPA